MKVLFVLECANKITNGTGATCLRFAKQLQQRGYEITFIGHDFDDPKDKPEGYTALPHYNFPVFQGLIEKEGFNFVKCDDEKMYKAIKDVDLVHVFLPFKLENKARIMAQALNIPVTSAFHLQPQNITSAIHIGKIRLINDILYYSFKKYMFNYTRHVHCPSQMIANQLAEHNYKRNKYHVISNGVNDYFHPIEVSKPEEIKDKIIVTMSGRLASEKRQDLIIKAVACSKYKDRIKILLCGQGPNKNRYIKLAEKKAVDMEIKFCDQEELRNILNYSDIYVHASDFEIEGISAIEAFACGAVPVISDSKLSATNNFSLSRKCIFKHGSYKSLRDHIDYFIEHPDKCKELSERYINNSSRFYLPKMVDMFEEMLKEAIEDHETEKDLPTVLPRKKDRRKARAIFKRLKKKGVIDELPEKIR
ncbi:MAG: glycosyltransferase [Bacilli bacterium]|nr:glycosyltransferase [Bacilli bacterium]